MDYLREQGYVDKEIIMGIRPEDLYDESTFIETSKVSIIDVKIEVTELLGAETIVYSQIAKFQKNVMKLIVITNYNIISYN